MAEKPYKFYDRRGQNTGYSSANNQLIKAATQSTDRKAVPNSNYDIHRNVSSMGLRQLRNVGNYIFANFPPVHGALLEQAELSASTFIPQFIGEDKDWGAQAESMLMEHGRIMDLSGWPSDDCNYRKNLIIGVRRDGDHATLLTENEDGYPFIQVIETHRIGNWSGDSVVADGPYKGLPMINGVIVNEFGSTVAYRVYDNPNFSNTYRDIPAQSLILSFFPKYPNQKRGITDMACCAEFVSDALTSQQYELLAQMIGSSITLVETNEAGEPAPGASFVTPATAGSTTTGTPTGLITESYDGGTIRYIRSGSGEKIDSFSNDRPSANSQAFIATILRSAFAGMEWPIDFSLDPTKAGGAQMRVVVEKVISTILKNQALVEKNMRRIDGYRISKFIKLGLLPENKEWWKWTYQGPAMPTADAKYDSDIALQEIRGGIDTRARACARRGTYYEEVDAQRELETDSLLARAQRLSKKYGMTIQEVITLMNTPTPNGMPAQPAPAAPTDPATN